MTDSEGNQFMNKDRNKSFLRVCNNFLVLSLVTAGVMACQPRGESKSVNEILSLSSQAYRQAFDGEPLPERVSGRLPELSDALQRIVDETELARKQAIAGAIVDHLRSLVISAGYTTRPALGELIDQFSAIAQKDVRPNLLDDSAVALLASRTFYLLAAELKGIRFQLGDREAQK
jgi:hypothetical protein